MLSAILIPMAGGFAYIYIYLNSATYEPYFSFLIHILHFLPATFTGFEILSSMFMSKESTPGNEVMINLES